MSLDVIYPALFFSILYLAPFFNWNDILGVPCGNHTYSFPWASPNVGCNFYLGWVGVAEAKLSIILLLVQLIIINTVIAFVDIYHDTIGYKDEMTVWSVT